MRRALLISIPMLLALPSLAVGKGLDSGQACGPSGCATTAFHDRFPSNFVLPPMLTTGASVSQPPHAAPWYRVRFSLTGVGPGGDLKAVVFADGSYVGGRDEGALALIWQRLSAPEAAFYRHLTRGLEPYPAAALPGPAKRGGTDSTTDPAASTSPNASPAPGESEDAGGWSPWSLLGAAAAAVALLGALVTLGRRRRRRGPAAQSPVA
jgi:hypothetical protein